jgi:GxxExxY protein
MSENLLYNDLTDVILHCFYDVYNTLGYGFLEKVYEKSLLIRLTESGLKAKNQLPIKVYFHDEDVGDYYADIIVEDKVILELKAEEHLDNSSKYQLLNYLRATGKKVGFVLNFGKKPEIKRMVNSKVKI